MKEVLKEYYRGRKSTVSLAKVRNFLKGDGGLHVVRMGTPFGQVEIADKGDLRSAIEKVGKGQFLEPDGLKPVELGDRNVIKIGLIGRNQKKLAENALEVLRAAGIKVEADEEAFEKFVKLQEALDDIRSEPLEQLKIRATRDFLATRPLSEEDLAFAKKMSDRDLLGIHQASGLGLAQGTALYELWKTPLEKGKKYRLVPGKHELGFEIQKMEEIR